MNLTLNIFKSPPPLQEVIGVKTMAMLGRYRRRIATAALGALVAADTCRDIYEPRKLARVVGLAVQVVPVT